MEKKLFNDINVYNVNAEKRNGAGFPYDDEGNKKIVSLNGKWKFKYAKKIADIPENYYAADYDEGGDPSRENTVFPLAAADGLPVGF